MRVPPVRWRLALYFMYTSRMRKSWTPELTFDLPDGTTVAVTVTRLLNGGYAGREQDEVAAHVAELAELGVPAPEVTPALYPVAPYLAAQRSEEHTSELQSRENLVCRLLLEKKKVL